MHLTENALTVLKKRYFKKDEEGNLLEDWDSMIDRVAANISGGDAELKKKYKNLLDSGYFLPNSPTLMNAGSDLQQLSACFVLPLEDSMDDIFETVKNAALIHKSGGGTGFSFSRLRETNARVKSTNGVSSGPITFLKVFNAATDAVKQGGTRRGANMAILNVDHPQILEFITCKDDPKELNNFNISVGITDKFMDAVYSDSEYELISPHTGKVTNRLNARDVFTLIVEMAHKNGEPGIIFIDRINAFNPTPQIGKIESTNPCGEQPLLPNEACNLGSINLAAMWDGDKIDWELMKKTVHESVHFLDDVISKSKFPLEKISEMAEANRKIGLGVMGFADLLYAMKIPYNSEEAVELAQEIMEYVDYHSKAASVDLALQKGSFPNFEGSIYESGNLQREAMKLDWDKLKERIRNSGIRNATTTTIAPTGTISMIANTSSGIEPQFSLVFTKNVMDGEKLIYINPYFEEAIREAGLYSEELMERISDEGIAKIDEIPAAIKKIFVTSHDISPEWHIRMQAAFQKYTDNAVSKTINFSHEASKEDIHTAYELAYELGCKGATVYRDGSRDNQVLTLGSKEKKDGQLNDKRVSPRQRPDVTLGMTKKIQSGCGHLYVTINTDKEGPCEVFTQMGKVGGCASAQLEAIARLTSLCLRSHVKVNSIIKQLQGIRCPSPMWHKGEIITSCADGVAKALQTYLNNSDKLTGDIKPDTSKKSNQIEPGMKGAVCPDCGSAIEFSEGCLKCHACGWSKC